MMGFCFSKPGEELGIQYPDPGSDFYIFLTDFARENNVTEIVMTPADMKCGYNGVKDLLKYGFNVVVLDREYTPINDDVVLPVLVHRDPNTLERYFPDCIVIGELIPLYHRQRRLKQIKARFQDGESAYSMTVLKSGWTVKSSTGSANRVNTRLYEYVVERDYELETKNAKPRK